ncbi:MAG: hypothetical protein ACKOQ6_09215, partial [Bacteroidota bacterium]
VEPPESFTALSSDREDIPHWFRFTIKLNKTTIGVLPSMVNMGGCTPPCGILTDSRTQIASGGLRP